MAETHTRPTLRVVVTGDSQAGKTSLVRRYVNNYFPKKRVAATRVGTHTNAAPKTPPSRRDQFVKGPRTKS